MVESSSVTPKRYRWEVAARVALAFVGGFAGASALGAFCATAVAKLGWMPIAQSVHVFTQASFVFWCALAMWVFYEASLKRVALGIFTSTALFAIGLAVVR